MDKQFIYKAKNDQGEDVSGVISAQTARDAAIWLHRQNLIVLEITKKRNADAFLSREFALRFKPVGAAEFGQFCRQFQIMIGAGISILKCLEMIGAEMKNKSFAGDIRGTCSRIQSGESLSQALAAYPKSFPELFIFMVEAGELSGNLTEILTEMAEYYETQDKNHRQLQQILFYPLILICTATLVLIFLLTYVLPTFVDMFEAMDAALPKPTAILLAISQMLTAGWPRLVLAAGVALLLFYLIMEVPKVALVRDYLKTILPLTGRINQKRGLAMMAKTLALLLNSGIDLMTALNRLTGVTENRYLKKEVLILVEKTVGGKSLAQGMAESAAFPGLFCQLVRVGESAGSLPIVLESVYRIYKDEVQNRIQLLSTALEPLILIVLGGVVLFILAAVMLPVFDIYASYASM
jgi:type IV pilus assembly protein PilC